MFRKSLIALMVSGAASGAVWAAQDGAPADAPKGPPPMHRHHEGHGPEGQHGMRHEQHLQERFAAADTNKDGALTRDEAKAGAPMLDVVFESADVNKDGRLSLDEVKGFHERMHAAHEGMRKHHMADMVKKLDTNGDGSISKQEAGKSPLARHFDQLDTNKDGQLSMAEIEAGKPHRGKHLHGERQGAKAS